MKKFAKSLLCFVLVISFALCLGACKKKPEKLAGMYVVTCITYADGTQLTGDALKQEMEEGYGLALEDTYLQLNADGTGVLSVYGFSRDIGFEYGKFWYGDIVEYSVIIDEEMALEFDEDGLPIEQEESEEPTEFIVPESIKQEMTISRKTITLDPEDLGETFTFTKVNTK